MNCIAVMIVFLQSLSGLKSSEGAHERMHTIRIIGRLKRIMILVKVGDIYDGTDSKCT